MGGYREEFPDFGEIDVQIPAGFEDISWRNDPCPSFGDKELGLVLFVDYKDAGLREFPETPRFTLRSVGTDGFGEIVYGDGDIDVISTDDFDAVIAEVDARRGSKPTA